MQLTASGLVVARGGVRIAGPLDFALVGGKALVVTGENGAGKSTLLRTVAGLLPPAGGTIAFHAALRPGDEPVTRVAEACHYLGHRNAMKPGLSVGANLTFWQAFLSPSPIAAQDRRIEDALARVGLENAISAPFGYLSAGQQRRAAIARLLVAPRPLWIVDEPTAALDAASQTMFDALLGDHLNAGGAVLAATHQPLGIDADGLHLDRRGDRRTDWGDSAEAAAALAAAEGWL